MFFDRRVRRFAGATSLGLAVLGAAVAATHPAATANALVIAENTVTCGTSAACFIAKNTSSGPGVLATSATGIALQGTGGRYGVQGKSTSNYGVFGTSSAAAGVAGTTPNAYGVYGFTGSGNGYGVVGYTSANGVGTYGGSTTGSGVEGNATNGYGVYGLSSKGSAVFGFSSDVGYGLVGESNSGTALYAASTSGFGIQSYANGADGIYTRNANGNAIDAQGTYIGLLGRSPAGGSTTYPLVLTDQNANDLFWVDIAGNVNYHGGLFQFSRVSGGATVKSFGARTSSPTIEDTGSAQLVNGAAVVRLDPTFAASIDTTSAYRVFLTPDGDTRGLFVASKTPSGFVVHETQGGRATLNFDYRIVATSFGQAGQRMAVANLATAPHAAQPAVPKLPVAKAPAIPSTPVQ